MESTASLEKEIVKVYKVGASLGLTDKQLRDATSQRSRWTLPKLVLITSLGALACALWLDHRNFANLKDVSSLSDVKIWIKEELFSWKNSFISGSCLVDMPEYFMEAGRPIVDCSMCRGIDSAPIKSKISRDEFLAEHAYTGKPVLVRNATDDWTAFDTFSFAYFKKVFKKKRQNQREEAVEEDEAGSGFFAYKTNFVDLQHFFSMSKAREKRLKWYVGWSNSDKMIMKKLRKHYQRPEFLPESSECSNIDWIFMGGSGPGAMIHIDAVSRPSWQAQIKGMKTWYLYPPPECEHVCKPFNITMHKGDIVVVDTNVWYHSTYIHPGEISITIGSEYD